MKIIQKKIQEEREKKIIIRKKLYNFNYLYMKQPDIIKYVDIVTGLLPDPNTTGLYVGYNWTTYYCLCKKNKYFPIEIMCIINTFLNWIPAGFWKLESPTLKKICRICGMYIPSYNEGLFKICSISCEEKYYRNKLINRRLLSLPVLKAMQDEINNERFDNEFYEFYMQRI